MTKENWKKRLGVVYSTDPNFQYNHNEQQEEETLDAGKQLLRIELDRKRRKGKQVTLITGFVGTKEDLKLLEKELKKTCGVGGSAKDGEIILQGDFRKRINEYLQKKGYKTKLIGG